MSTNDNDSKTDSTILRDRGTSEESIDLEQGLKHLIGLGIEDIETEGVQEGFRYQERRELGKGGNGVVVSVFDEKMRRVVALKRVHGPFLPADQRARFLVEAQVTGQLAHPNVMPVYDMGTDPDGRVFFTMKQVHGRSLRQLLDESLAGTLVDRLLIFLQVCNGVAFAHSRGVIHRDLKPGNIMVGQFGEVLIVDWGLLKLLDRPNVQGEVGIDEEVVDILQTRVGEVAGTPAYMAPEQARGQSGEVDAQTDVYSLGALLYALLTDSSPFSGEPHSIIDQVRKGEFEPPMKRAPGQVPRELNAIVLTAMSNDKVDRYASVTDLSDDVQAFLEGRPVSVVDYSILQRLVKWAGRHKHVVRAVGLTSCVAAVALGAGGLFYVDRIGDARDAALLEARRAMFAERSARVELAHGRIAEAMGEAMYGRAGVAVDRLQKVRSELVRLETDPMRADLAMGLISRASILPRLRIDVSPTPHAGFISADGSRLLVVPREPGEARYFELPSGRELAQWGPVEGRAEFGLIEDGVPWLLQVTDQGILGWHPPSEQRRRWSLPGGSCAPKTIVYAARRLLSACNGVGLLVWSWDDPEHPTIYPDKGERLGAMSMSEDGTRFLVSGLPFRVIEDGRTIWADTKGRQPRRMFMSPDGQWIVREAADTFEVIHVDTGVAIPRVIQNVIARLRWSADSRMLSVIDMDGTLTAYEVGRGGLREIHQHRIAPISGEKPQLMADATSHRWLTFSGDDALIFEMDQPRRPLADLDIDGAAEMVQSPSGRLIAVGTEKGHLSLLDTDTGVLLREWTSVDAPVRGLSFVESEDRIVSAHWDGAARIWNLETEELIREIRPGAEKVTDVQVLDDQRVAIGGSDGQISIWDMTTGERLQVFDGLVRYVWDFGWHEKTQRLAASDRMAQKSLTEAVVLDLNTGEVISRVEGDRDSYNIVMSPDGSRFLLGRHDKMALAVTIESGEIARLPSDSPPSLCMGWSNDGDMIATSDYSGRVQLWTTDTWEPIASAGFSGLITGLRFDPRHRAFLAMNFKGQIHEIDFGGRRDDWRASYRSSEDSRDEAEAWRRAWRSAAVAYDWEDAHFSLEMGIRAGLEVEPLEQARFRAAAGDHRGALSLLEAMDQSDSFVRIWVSALRRQVDKDAP